MLLSNPHGLSRSALGLVVTLALGAVAACGDASEVTEQTSVWIQTEAAKADQVEQTVVLLDAALDSSLTDVQLEDLGPTGDVQSDTVNLDSSVQDVDEEPAEPPALLVPEFDEEPSPTCSEAQSNSWYFQFLDDLCDEKRDPSDQDRARTCAVADSSPEMVLADGTVVTYEPDTLGPTWDTTSLAGLVPEDMEISVILIKRVNGVPHYRRLSNGRHDIAFQPWSTTKILAAANAGSYMRLESSGQVGLDATVGDKKVGDLVTSVVNYDSEPYTSNGLAAYFHNIGGRDRAKALIGDLWLNRPETESFGGNYGDAVPPVGYDFKSPAGISLNVTPDTSAGYANHLSTATLAESVKRLVLHREEPSQRLPGLEWPDVQVLLYGAANSTKGLWGGMSADTAYYLQAGHDMDYIEARSQGQWMTFSKLGLGSQGQFVHTGYACFPVLNDQGDPVEGHGREFVIAAHLKSGGGGWAGRDRELARIYRRLELRIVDGRL